MINEFFKKILDETPEDEKIFVDKYEEITMRIYLLLKKKGLTQKNLAEKLGKRPSEISKWLNDGHNLTLKSIAKIEAALGEEIIYILENENEEFLLSKNSKISASFESKRQYNEPYIEYFESKKTALKIAI